MELDLLVEKLGWLLFKQCCAMEGPQVLRTDADDLLVKKMFELVWRLKSHRKSKAFDKLCDLGTSRSPSSLRAKGSSQDFLGGRHSGKPGRQ